MQKVQRFAAMCLLLTTSIAKAVPARSPDAVTACDIGHSFIAVHKSVHVGDDVLLYWCNPSYSLVDSGYYVSFYRIYASSNSAGPFTPLTDISGADTTHTTLRATEAGTRYYYIESHGCQGAIVLCAMQPETTKTSSIIAVTTSGSTCLPGPGTLCLLKDRFQVTVDWRSTDPVPPPGLPTLPFSGYAVPLNDRSGYFWFFTADNVEVTIKAIDACPSAFWIFSAGMTNLPVELTVTDTRTGSVRKYASPGKGAAFAPILDTSAFSCP